jgi:hypothetical protein
LTSFAAFYPLLEQLVFGSTLSRARSFFISQATQGKNVLLIGEGLFPGSWLASNRKQNDKAGLDCGASDV